MTEPDIASASSGCKRSNPIPRDFDTLSGTADAVRLDQDKATAADFDLRYERQPGPGRSGSARAVETRGGNRSASQQLNGTASAAQHALSGGILDDVVNNDVSRICRAQIDKTGSMRGDGLHHLYVPTCGGQCDVAIRRLRV